MSDRASRPNTKVATLRLQRDVPGLLRLLSRTTASGRTEEYIVAFRTVETLGDLADPLAVEPLIALLGNGPRNLETHVAKALGTLGDQRAVPVLIDLLRKPRPSSASWYGGAQKAAAEALGRLG